MGAFLSGRVTYELMARFWPTADKDPASTAPMIEFARIWRDMPKIELRLVETRTFGNGVTLLRYQAPEIAIH